MKTPTINIRIHYKTFSKLKKQFPAVRGETMASYFQRLAEWIEGQK